MPIMIFSIPQVVNLVLPESSGTTGAIMSNYPVQRTDFRIVRGVQNEIEFFVRDIDRNFVNLPTGSTLVLHIADPEQNANLISMALTVQDATRALYRATITAIQASSLNIGMLRYSISVMRPDTTVVMLWTDRDYSPYGYLQVSQEPILTPALPTILNPANFVPSSGILGGDSFNLDTTVRFSTSLPGAAQQDYSNGVHTISAKLSGYTGCIIIQATLIPQPAQGSDWFNVTQQNFTADTGTHPLNAIGNFYWVRIVLSQMRAGTVTEILYKN